MDAKLEDFERKMIDLVDQLSLRINERFNDVDRRFEANDAKFFALLEKIGNNNSDKTVPSPVSAEKTIAAPGSVNSVSETIQREVEAVAEMSEGYNTMDEVNACCIGDPEMAKRSSRSKRKSRNVIPKEFKKENELRRRSLIDTFTQIEDLNKDRNMVIRNPAPFDMKIKGRSVGNFIRVIRAIQDYEVDNGIKVRLQSVITPEYGQVLIHKHLMGDNWRYCLTDYQNEDTERLKNALVEDLEPTSLDDFLYKLKQGTLQNWRVPKNIDKLAVSHFHVLYVQVAQYASQFMDVFDILERANKDENFLPKLHRSARQYVKREHEDPRSLVGMFLNGIPGLFGGEIHSLLTYDERTVNTMVLYVDMFMKKLTELYRMSEKHKILDSIIHTFNKKYFNDSIKQHDNSLATHYNRSIHSIESQGQRYVEEEDGFIHVAKEDLGYEDEEEFCATSYASEPSIAAMANGLSHKPGLIPNHVIRKPVLENGGEAPRICYAKANGKSCDMKTCPYDHSQAAIDKEIKRLSAIRYSNNLPIPNTRLVQPTAGKYSNDTKFTRPKSTNDDDINMVYYDPIDNEEEFVKRAHEQV